MAGVLLLFASACYWALAIAQAGEDGWFSSVMAAELLMAAGIYAIWWMPL